MKQKVGNIEINYVRYGNPDGKSLILLHGWGQNIDMMRPIGDRFQSEFDIIIIDLPGFGESEKPEFVWTIHEYAACVHQFLQQIKVEKPIMIGHSFGGKITLDYASRYGCEKIVILAAPFKREIVNLSMKTKLLKQLKKVPILNKFEETAKKHIGSRDYRNADPILRKILVEHVNLDLTEEVKAILCPSLLIWGTEDTEVPEERAYELEKLIKDSGVVMLEGGTHYAYLEYIERVISILRNFL